MLYTQEEAFAKAVKAQKPTGVVLLYGEESYLIEAWTKRLMAPFGGDQDAFNVQRLDGRKLDGDMLADAVETLPLMASEKCVLVDDLELKGMPTGVWETLTAVVEDVPPTCTLILTGKPGVFDAKSAQGKKLVKLCAAAGTAVQLGSRTPAGMVNFLRSAAKKQGAELSPEMARYLLRLADNDMQSLGREVEKVCAYAGGRPITEAHIDAVVIPRTEVRVFDLGKAILAGNPQRALEILHDLFDLREQPIAILSALSMTYVDLYRARVAKESGKTLADVVGRFGYKGREFRVNNAWNSRLSAQALRASLDALAACDMQLKSTAVDGQVLLEQTVIQLFAIQGKDKVG